MSLYRFKYWAFVWLAFIPLKLSAEIFTDNQCLEASFDSTIEHSSLPFGFMKESLRVKKSGCQISLNYIKLKFLKTNWIVDVCRGPIHIKEENSGGHEVFKKIEPCSKESKDRFCKATKLIEEVIQDNGLIFAEGEKEDIESQHGQVYCTYLLLRKYLDEEVVFSKYQTYTNFLMTKDYFKSLGKHEETLVPSTPVHLDQTPNVKTESQEHSPTGSF